MKKWVAIGAAVVVVLWIVVTLGAPLLAQQVWPNLDPQKMGQIGDSFGAASALFAGLGSLGVVIVLAYDLSHRKEEFRPFVTLSVRSVSLTRASWAAGHFTATVEMESGLESVTQSPALNLELSAALVCGTVTTTGDVVVANAPLPTGPPRGSTVNFTLTGPHAQAMVAALGDQGVVVSFRARYEGLNGTPWASTVSFKVTAGTGARSDVLATLDDSGSHSIEPSSSTDFGIEPVFLNGTATPGTWRQGRG